MLQETAEQDVTITSRGQLTLPVRIRRALKLGSKRKVRITIEDGVVTMRPLPDVNSFFGALKTEAPYDPREKQKARKAMARRTSVRKH